MRESAGYQIILDEGRIDEAKKLILRLGTTRLGPPSPAIQKLLETIEDLDRLGRIVDRFADPPESVSDWQDLLATP